MELTRAAAEEAVKQAHECNPGPWADHSRYVAQACYNIAERCPHMDQEKAYI